MPSLRRLLALVPLSLSSAVAADPPPVNFGREVLPILSDKCFFCHGPDEKKRKAGRRLDTLEGATAEKDGVIAVVPGKVAESELVARILSTDPEEMMPPPKSNKTLTPAQRETLRRWVAEGAKWGKHWAFEKPERPAVPTVGGVANPIDAFIRERLAREGLKPSPEAARETLIRRVTLDLTGLPPTPEEVDAFLADQAPAAFERVVDRLLASPHYGERMALPWLDAARYADSNGFQQDGDTHQWVWRDWVVRALNANMPFDRFTIEQLAGDLLPDATLDQKVASAFNRNHMLNGEGGAIPEEQRNVILFDRVDTTATNWLGLTVACAQCHDHKFDPIKQRDYYSLMAFFNNVPENGTPTGSGQYRIADPAVTAGTPEELAKLKTLEDTAAVATAEEKKQADAPEVEAAFAAWEKSLPAETAIVWTAQRPLTAEAGEGVTLTLQDDLSIFATGPRPDKTNYTVTLPAVKGLTGFRIDTIPDDRLPSKGAGRSDSGNAVLTRLRFSVGEKKMFFSTATADYTQDGFSPQGAIDEDPGTAWAFYPDTAKPHFLTVQLPEPLTAPEGVPLTLRFEFQSANKQHQFGRFRIATTTDAQPVGRAGLPAEIAAILKKDTASRSADEGKKLRAHFLAINPTAALAAARKKKQAAEKALADFKTALPRVMVMSDAQPRQTKILDRGNYLAPKDDVLSATPAFLPAPAAQDAPMNRLSLARWLVSAEQPLTSRVIVNRYWQTFFGLGLVRTSEDFGVQSEQPIQRELLDWLAVEFRESGWDVKRLHRLIVTSATYRQSSAVTPQLRERDPENRLYARSSRFRLPALLIRDQALAASELLGGTLGGKPVYPYQPSTIWDSLAITKERDFTYPQSKGSDLYRRSLYTFWRRTVAPSNIFDASARNVCKVRLGGTNTPLHALTTLNDPTFIEAARVLAEHALHDASPEPEKRLALAFRRVLARWPDAAETKLLRTSLDKQLAKFSAVPKAAETFLTTGATPRDTTLDVSQFAAYATVCLGILNLDETLTKE